MNTNRIAAAALVAGLAAAAAYAAGQTPSPRAPDVQGVVKGYRGFPLPLSGDQVAFVKKGDRLDVLATFDAAFEKDVKEKVTATILQNVLVVDVRRPDKLEGKGAVEILLNPNEAQYAALGIVQGEMRVIVRAPDDREMKPQEMAAFRKLFGK